MRRKTGSKPRRKLTWKVFRSWAMGNKKQRKSKGRNKKGQDAMVGCGDQRKVLEAGLSSASFYVTSAAPTHMSALSIKSHWAISPAPTWSETSFSLAWDSVSRLDWLTSLPSTEIIHHHTWLTQILGQELGINGWTIAPAQGHCYCLKCITISVGRVCVQACMCHSIHVQ